MTSSLSFLMRFHLVAAAGAGLVLATVPKGLAVCLILAVWNVAFATLAPGNLRALWRFAATISIFQVIPDLFLAKVLRSIEFTDHGVHRIGGEIPIYMAAMWTIPLVWLLACFHHINGQPTSCLLYTSPSPRDS